MGSFSGLLNNAALMLILCVIYDTFGIYAISQKNLRDCITGVLVGLIGIAVMFSPWSLQPGVFFDTRWVLLSLCGLFFGLIPTSIAVIIAGTFLLYQGGSGGIVGTVVIVITAGVGLAWKYWKDKHNKPLSWKQLYAFGVIVQLAVLSCMFLMPADIHIPMIKAVAPPILLIHPILTMIIGLILKRQEDRRDVDKELVENRKALIESEKQLHALLQSIQTAVVVHGPDTGIITCNKASQELLGLTEEQMLGKEAIDPAWKFFNEDESDMALDDYPVNRVIKKKDILRNLIVGINRPEKNDVIWVLANAVPEFASDGNITRVIVTFMDITLHKEGDKERERLIRNLQKALDEIKTLRGILPLCSFCKKVRDDQGYWEQVDVYIHKYSEADISHSICPECIKKNYPEEYEDLKKRGQI